jgi:hypothetical protein
MKMNRRERKELARQNGTRFIPKYNGKGPRSYEEFYGVGYERFNNKFVTIAEVK